MVPRATYGDTLMTTLTSSASWKALDAITGGLSKPSKMPSFGWSIPAQACGMGSLLRKVKGSPCSGCYALKGRYVFRNVQGALERRLALYNANPAAWEAAMVASIAKAGRDVFRWFDSGDLQGLAMLEAIGRIASALPGVRFWLPTQERGILREAERNGWTPPPNLTIRVSGAMIDREPTESLPAWAVRSMVRTSGRTCPAPDQGNECRDCRACWDREVPLVSYGKH